MMVYPIMLQADVKQKVNTKKTVIINRMTDCINMAYMVIRNGFIRTKDSDIL